METIRFISSPAQPTFEEENFPGVLQLKRACRLQVQQQMADTANQPYHIVAQRRAELIRLGQEYM